MAKQKHLKKNQYSDRELFTLWLDIYYTVESGTGCIEELQEVINGMKKTVRRAKKKLATVTDQYEQLTGRVPSANKGDNKLSKKYPKRILETPATVIEFTPEIEKA